MDEKQVLELAIKVEGVDNRCRSNEHRIEDLEKDMVKTQDTQITLVKLTNNIENMCTQIVSIKEDVQDVKNGQKELSSKVVDIENRPARETKRRWDDIGDKLLWLLIGGFAIFILEQVLPNIF